ncbi:sucrase ferredoxin [Nocardioides sp.]|uniref:sucrase ferredoxin n=1 Tax=Nocardioides sp. TaxID=35761 RepID=UPI003526D41B
MDDFRCAAASIDDREPLAGTAPTETAWLFVEHPGPWGRQAVAEARWPESVRAALTGRDDLRVQLVRRPTRSTGGLRVFAATASSTGFDVGATVLGDPEELLGLELDSARPALGLPAYADPLWLVCTNGRRDRCCAELGRPVTSALAARWPEHTWETTHLGGHRFAGTLLALPSGVTLGRLGADDAVGACEAVLRGDLPPERVRGRAGLAPAAQVAELAVRALRSGPTSVAERGHGRFEVAAGAETYDVSVAAAPGPARRQSCAAERTKATTLLSVESLQVR